jgi:hypothetical protein
VCHGERGHVECQGLTSIQGAPRAEGADHHARSGWRSALHYTTGNLTRLFVGIAALLLRAGVWAMLSPENFYAEIATYPPFNRHFVHDIGVFQLGLGARLALALIFSDALRVALAGSTVAALAHFVSHFIDGELGGQPRDPLTIGQLALVLLGLTAWRVRTLSQAGW